MFTVRFEVDDAKWASQLNIPVDQVPDNLRDLAARNSALNHLPPFLRQILTYATNNITVSLGASAARLPCGGDAVRLISPHPLWDDVSVGAIGVIQGLAGVTPINQVGEIVFYHTTFRGCVDGRDAIVVQSAGSPRSGPTAFADLKPTNDIVSLDVWRGRPGAVDWHSVPALVWDWSPALTL